MRMDLIHILGAIAIVSTATACDSSKDNCAQDAAGCGCYPDANCGKVLGSTGTGGSTGAGGSTAADGPTEVGGFHGTAALSDCFGASKDPQNCNEVCATTKQVCVAGGCGIGRSDGGVTYEGFKTGFECSNWEYRMTSQDSCNSGFYWDGENMMVVRCCCADGP